MGPNGITISLYKEDNSDTQTQERRACEIKGKDWTEVSKSQGIPKIAHRH